MKILKKIAAFAVAVCTLACMIALAACEPKEPEDPTTATYTVTVDCEDSDALLGLKVQLKTENGTVAASSTLTDGKASFSLDKATYSVELVPLSDVFAPLFDLYEYEPVTLTAEKTSATVYFTPVPGPENARYTVIVQLPDGTPVENVGVQICSLEGDGGICSAPALTNAEGRVSFEFLAGNWVVHVISGTPSGYTFDNTKYTMDENGGTLIVFFDPAA